ncbi:hypothetical protein JOL79_11955 [Microbispora sp. RL4-1S]|uniref:ATPase n=1 Tax=Microbispora oryzae TaxID=2806554 RepID=A0A940WGT4_9ACTN|nr:hypothetical protein [Microbispora oryzae]MBP2704528.1 hypothetical protein [Microbispora oryzae]
MTAMGVVAVIGESVRVAVYATAGALVLPAEDAEAAREAWRTLGPEVAVVILTPAAARSLAAEETPETPGGPPAVVMPQ